jgi:uncharacterized protein YciU (UPF0263 family)
MFDFVEFTITAEGEAPTVGTADDWVMAIYFSLTKEQQREVRAEVRRMAEHRRARRG